MLQDVSLYPKNGKIVTDSGLTFDPALLPTAGKVIAASQYAPSSQTSLTMTGTTGPAASMAAWDSTHINTGNFVAPPSGNVLVEVLFSGKSSVATAVCVMGLCEHGSVTPMIGVTSSIQMPASSVEALSYRSLVTGLTPGSTHNFDFMGACFTSGDTFFLVAMGLTGTLTVGSAGSPVTMTVTAM